MAFFERSTAHMSADERGGGAMSGGAAMGGGGVGVGGLTGWGSNAGEGKWEYWRTR